MEELVKADNNIMKMGGNSIAREATMKELEGELSRWKEWATKASEWVSDLEKVGNKQKKEITKLK